MAKMTTTQKIAKKTKKLRKGGGKVAQKRIQDLMTANPFRVKK